MAIELRVPSVGESITEVEIGEWLVSEGQYVAQDTIVVMIETDKVTAELVAPAGGVITKISKQQGEQAAVGDVVGLFEAQDAPATAGTDKTEAAASAPDTKKDETSPQAESRVMPAAARVLAEKSISAADVTASGPGGRILKEDVEAHVAKASQAPTAVPTSTTTLGAREEQAVPMTSLRRRVAKRLLEAGQETAMLTTFNEVDMSAVMQMRRQYQDEFVKKHEIKLGFMSFFVRAAIDGLRQFPAVNAEIRDNQIIYRDYYDIGIAVGGGRGLVVPVVRNAQHMGFADLEKCISDFGARARNNKLTIDELQGGTFTITNGGIYGSMMSTPILNRPQSAILGMHAIKERAVVVAGQVEVRPMMYLALTYDHRLIDGREAVMFLVRIKDCIENPARMLVEI